VTNNSCRQALQLHWHGPQDAPGIPRFLATAWQSEPGTLLGPAHVLTLNSPKRIIYQSKPKCTLLPVDSSRGEAEQSNRRSTKSGIIITSTSQLGLGSKHPPWLLKAYG
jgi:hypothetical protein